MWRQRNGGCWPLTGAAPSVVQPGAIGYLAAGPVHQ
jgi:hypothetical protein